MAAPINPQAYYTNNTGYQIPQQAQIPQFPQYAYQQPYQTQQMPRQQSTRVFVRGIREAEEYPGDDIVMFDSSDPVFYTKKDGVLRVFDYTERIQNTNTAKGDYVTRQEFDELKKMLDELTK
jgi:hypothetical protein